MVGIILAILVAIIAWCLIRVVIATVDYVASDKRIHVSFRNEAFLISASSGGVAYILFTY